MTTINIDDLPEGGTITGVEPVPIWQEGEGVQVTIDEIEAFVAAAMQAAANTWAETQTFEESLSVGDNATVAGQVYVGASTTPVLNNGAVSYWPRTAAEVSAAVVPTNYNYPPYTLLRYGADPTGVNDSTTALQSACNCAAEAEYAMVTVGVPGATLKIGAAWTHDVNKTGIDFQGAYINASGFAAGGWWSPTQSNTNANQRALLNTAHPFLNAIIYGPGSANTTAICLNLADQNPISGEYWLAGLVFRNVAFWDWGQDVVFGNGAFFTDFSSCRFGSDGGTQTTYSVSNPTGVSNSGESNSFSQCRWFNKALIANMGNADGGNLYFSHCSLDVSVTAVNVTGGLVMLDSCHVEGSGDTAYYFNCTGVNAKIMFDKLDVVLDAEKVNYTLMYCDASCTWGGIFGRGLSFSAAAGYNAGPLVSGTGNTDIETYIGIGTAAGHPAYISEAQNRVVSPIFASNSLATDGWTAGTSGSGATAPAIVASNPYSGTYSVEFQGATDGESVLTSRIFPCNPGQQAFIQAQAKLPMFVAGAAFTCSVSYLNADGAAITAVIGDTTNTLFSFMDITEETSAYAPYGTNVSGGLGRAPPGTVGVQFAFSLGGGGATVGYLGQAIITIV